MPSMTLDKIALQLRHELRKQKFGPPVAYIYNPLEFAWTPHAEYLRRFGRGRREILLLGMNPGPWGMVQTGVPFGDVKIVSGWLGITGNVAPPDAVHPKRPVQGFSCRRSEISGSRLWGWARHTFETPDRFFERFFVVNYCPLCFFEADGKNRTPDRLPSTERERLFAVCDEAVRAVADCMKPKLVIGIGNFAESRAREALAGNPVIIARATHPSGANPRASRDWGGQMNATLRDLGVLP
jgi:single-strand selective monofunctional uracil DNA glycosylase